ncbi:zinc finger BED domain-containing protein 6-like [Tachysurus ichikawai]
MWIHPGIRHQSNSVLLSFKAYKKRSSTTQDSRIETQISKYFDAIHDTDTDTDNALSFWAKNHNRYPQLHNLAMKVLSVPASSAPVERVFSRGGIIMRPHRARLGHKMLQSLIFLKCNQMLL